MFPLPPLFDAGRHVQYLDPGAADGGAGVLHPAAVQGFIVPGAESTLPENVRAGAPENLPRQVSKDGSTSHRCRIWSGLPPVV